MPQARDRLNEQIEYYRARAGEYDEWFLRRGRYDRGPEINARWFAETEQLVQALCEFSPTGNVLELACGTGLFTQHLIDHATSVTAVDSSAEVIELNKQRSGSSSARYVAANIFEWEPDDAYDVVFFSFWLSHVPPERFAEFWGIVRNCLKPGGRAFFIDSLYNAESTAKNHSLQSEDEVVATRLLNDGRRFDIYKVFYQPDRLTNDLAALGWQATVERTAANFLFGFAVPVTVSNSR